jgi:hypothetical protein
VTAQTGPVSYSVDVTPGVAWRRHAVQLRSSNVPVQQELNIPPSELVKQQPVKPGIAKQNSSTPSAVPSNKHPATSLTRTTPEQRYPIRVRKPPKHLDDYV